MTCRHLANILLCLALDRPSVLSVVFPRACCTGIAVVTGTRRSHERTWFGPRGHGSGPARARMCARSCCTTVRACSPIRLSIYRPSKYRMLNLLRHVERVGHMRVGLSVGMLWQANPVAKRRIGDRRSRRTWHLERSSNFQCAEVPIVWLALSQALLLADGVRAESQLLGNACRGCSSLHHAALMPRGE